MFFKKANFVWLVKTVRCSAKENVSSDKFYSILFDDSVPCQPLEHSIKKPTTSCLHFKRKHEVFSPYRVVGLFF